MNGDVVITIPEPRASSLAAELELEGIDGITIVAPSAPILPHLAGAATLIAPAARTILTAELIAACDRGGVRIIPLGDGDSRLLGRYGLTAALPADAAGWQVAAAIQADSPATARRVPEPASRVIAVWGPQGAPGRSTVAIQLAVELARSGRRTALVDADTVAPALALLLGLSDDAPGIAAACRRAELGGLDSAELDRLAATVETSAGSVDVLAGINRPSRWPELSAPRLRTALQVCRQWAQEIVVDIGAALDADDETTFDLVGPRRHAATTAALREADLVVAVAAADPLGISRFLRDHAELRDLIGPSPIAVVVNQVRQGPLGIDARGQIRRTLDRFAGITDVTFLPYDLRAADAALLHARPMTDVTPRSPLVAAVRRLAGALTPAAPSGDSSAAGAATAPRRKTPATGGSWRESFRVARSPR
ncbi:P-loop NTPase [Microbacterium sp.]|uniref:AAA family ATPase n=1 Tax=Microbacterium sp. TaxID=51671 RepID=UPI002811B217|nr:P-loop NTPase [Microbacterium sp.]